MVLVLFGSFWHVDDLTHAELREMKAIPEHHGISTNKLVVDHWHVLRDVPSTIVIVLLSLFLEDDSHEHIIASVKL